MAKILEDRRRIEKALSTDVSATVPVSNDHTDGSWTPEDIYEHEIVITGTDSTDAKIQTRIGSQIAEFISKPAVEALITAGGSGIPEPVADGVFARLKAGVSTSWAALAANIVNFTDTTIDRLIDLVFEELTRSGSAVPSFFEKGVSTNVDFGYTIVENDDEITQTVWDGTTTSVAPFPLVGTANEPTATATVTRVLQIQKAVGTVANLTITSNAYIPQWRGGAVASDYGGDYATIEADLEKIIQSSDNQSKVFTLSGEYAFFISTNAAGTITDGNGFAQTVGVWGDGVSEFYRKTIVVTLADATTENMTIYRTRTQKTATVTYNFS